ncbi:MAG: redox-sensing transcriptional repressor Rex, partial [Actinomycetes bacterium]
VPAGVAQELCDELVAAGITSILSFAPVVLQVPDHVQLRKVDMATELQILAYHAQRAQDPDDDAGSDAHAVR